MSTVAPLDATSTAPMGKDGAFATCPTVPGWAQLLGTRRAVTVAGTCSSGELMEHGNGVRHATSCDPDGNEVFFGGPPEEES